MNSQVKYVIQGSLLAVVSIIVLGVVSLLYLANPVKTKESLLATAEPDSVYFITNVEGQYLFREKCSACHGLFKRVDPDLLQGFEQRIPDKKLLYEWIRNPGKVIKSGNPYFSGLYKEYSVMMTGFPDLTDQQIDDILAYLKQAELMKEH